MKRRRPLDPRAIPIASFQPQMFLVERHERFARYAAVFPKRRRVMSEALFDEISLTIHD